MDFLGKFHPILIHFPIALLTVYSFFEIVSLFYKEKSLDKFTLALLGLGVLFAVAAVFTGHLAEDLSYNLLNQVQKEAIETHETFATIVLFYFAALFFIKFYLVKKIKFTGYYKFAYIAMVLIGNIFIYLTGYYGGRLVFDYGIGTALLK